jgi:transposase
METIIRQSVGIDIAKATFAACICKQSSSCQLQHSEVMQFDNCKRGFNQLLKWVRKNKVIIDEPVFVMEATGIYYEPLAYHLHKLSLHVSVVLPNKVKHYAKSLNVKSKTDLIDARLIAQMGAERSLELWHPPARIFKDLRALTRLCTDLKVQKTVFENRLQSIEAGNEPLEFIIQSTESIIAKLDKEIEKCQAQIAAMMQSEQWLNEKVKKLLTIKGVGLISVAIIIAETQGFKLITNVKQLVSYAGYDVVERESGTSIKGRTKISKKGNSRIRAALHFPALVAARHNQHLKIVYQRINNNKPSKMVGVVALQRKLLILMYALWKNDTVYEEREEKITSGNQETKPLLRLNGKAIEIKTGRQSSLPAQDELPSNLSTEALLRLM